jgi:hypothetical protein
MLVILISIVVFFYRAVLSRLSPPQTVFEFNAELPETYTSLQSINGVGFTQSSDGKLVLGKNSNDFLEIYFESTASSLTSFHLSGLVIGRGDIQVELAELENQKKINTLACFPLLLHRSFNLSPYLKPGEQYRIRLTSINSDPGSTVVINELFLKRINNFPGLLNPIFVFSLFVFLAFYLGYVLIAIGVKKKSVVLFLTVCGLGFFMRMNAWYDILPQNLEGDSRGYYELSALFKWTQPYLTWSREPFFVWYQFLMSKVLGANVYVFRLATVLLSSSIVGLTFILTQKISRQWRAAFFAGMLMALGKFTVLNSVRGERAEIFVFLLLLFSLLAIFKNGGIKFEIILGVMSGFISLTWLVGAISVMLIYVVRVVRNKPKYSHVSCYLFTWFLLMAPFLFSQWKATGDPFYSLNVHTGYYRNTMSNDAVIESKEKNDSTWFDLIFHVLKPINFLKRTAFGFLSLLLDPRNPFNKIFLGFHYAEIGSYFLFPFYFIGILFSFLKRQWLGLVLFLSVLNISVGLLSQVRDPRLFLQAAPFFALFFGIGASFSLTYILLKFKNVSGVKVD